MWAFRSHLVASASRNASPGITVGGLCWPRRSEWSSPDSKSVASGPRDFFEQPHSKTVDEPPEVQTPRHYERETPIGRTPEQCLRAQFGHVVVGLIGVVTPSSTRPIQKDPMSESQMETLKTGPSGHWTTESESRTSDAPRDDALKRLATRHIRLIGH